MSPCLPGAVALTLMLVNRPSGPSPPTSLTHFCGISPFIILFGGGCFFAASSPSPNWLTFSIVTRIERQDILPLSWSQLPTLALQPPDSINP